MPRGGSRPGAGRKADPNSRRQKAAAKKVQGAVAAKKAPAKKAAAKPALGRGLTLPNGQKSPDAPPGWPFGTKPPEDPAKPADPETDDGLTDEQRAGMTPLEYMLAVMHSPKSSRSVRMLAAVQAAPYVHPKLAQKGKKEEALDKAKAKPGRFSPGAAPRLAAAGGKRVT